MVWVVLVAVAVALVLSSMGLPRQLGGTPTTTTLTPGTNPSSPGSTLLLTAVVNQPATGTITFYDGGSAIGSGSLVCCGSTLTITTASLTTGTHSLTAVYGGDSTYSGSTSSAVSESIAATGWSLDTAPPPTTTVASSIAGMYAASANDVWAVGSYNGLGYTDHFDGTTWSPIAMTGSPASLTSISGTSGTDVWVAGGTTVEHWNGTTWSAPVTASTKAINAIKEISASDIWTAGSTNTTDHYDGVTWTARTPAGIPGATSWHAIDADSTSNVWFAGYQGSANTTFTTHWTGAAFALPSSQPSQYAGPSSIAVLGPSNVLVGYPSDPAGEVAQWNGSSWVNTTLPYNANIGGLGHSSATDVWAVGGSGPAPSQAQAYHFDGATWTAVGPFNPATTGFLSSVTVLPGSAVWAGGTNLASPPTTLIESRGGSPAPAVTGVAPSSGSTAGGTGVTVTGSNFAGATAVKFGATAGTSLVVVNATTITVNAPAGALGTIDVTVTTPAGTSTTSAADHFTYVTLPASTTVVASGLDPAGPGASVPLTATVTGAGPIPTGSVTFYDGASALSTVALSAGSASYSTTGLSSAMHQITAVYSGDSSYSGSTSPLLLELVGQALPAWGWGDNTYGDVGDGTGIERNSPVPVAGTNRWLSIASGDDQTVALRSDGTVWTWGYNVDGELGNGSADSLVHATPTQIASLSNIVAVTPGYEHGLALKSDGTVWSWGQNIDGQLGDGTTTQRNIPVEVCAPGQVAPCGSFLSNIVALGAGNFHSLAVRSDGTVWAWGLNTYGALGDNTVNQRIVPVQAIGISNAVAVAADSYSSLARLADGTMAGWGYNGVGELGDGSTVDRHAPVAVHTVAGVTSIATMADTALALESNGQVWAWGWNNYGTLGNGTTDASAHPNPAQVLALGNTVTAVGAGNEQGYAVAAGVSYAWGFNTAGALGDGTTTQRTSPTKVAGPSITPAAIGGGGYNGLALAMIPTNTTLGASINPSVYGQTVTYTATVAPVPAVATSTTATTVYGQGGSYITNSVNNGGISATSIAGADHTLVDGNGSLYVSDAGNNRVLFFPAGSITATRVYGQGGAFTTGGANQGGLSANSLNDPVGLALDSAGDLYIADFGNNRVLYYAAGSTTATRVYGQGGSFTSNTANNGGITANSLSSPYGVALDTAGNLYISDGFNNRVLYYGAGSTTATQVYGQGGVFTTATVNKGGLSATSLDQPFGIALDGGGDLYVGDALNNRVLYYASGSTTATRVYGQGGSFTTGTVNLGGISATSLNEPFNLALDAAGNLYVADWLNNRALFYPAGATTANAVYGQGGAYTTNIPNNGGITANGLFKPEGLAFDAHNNLYLSDGSNNRVLTFAAPAAEIPTGTVTFKDGAATIGSGTLNGAAQTTYATAGLTAGAHAITAVYNGDLLNLGDPSPLLTQTVNPGSTAIAVAAAPNPSSAGQVATFTATVTAVGPAAGIPTGLVTFRDAGISLGTGALNGIGQATLATAALAAGTHTITAFYGGDSNFAGSTAGSISEYAVPSGAANPAGIVTGPDGNLWFTEFGANKIAKVTPGGAFTEYTIPTAASQPRGIAAGSDGNLWFTESATNKVTKVTTGGAFTEYTIPTAASTPFRIAAGPDGNLWFTENATNKVAKVTTSGTFTEYTVPTAGSGSTWITAGPDGNLWFTESSAANKVAKVTTSGVFTEYSIPTGGSSPQGIIAGSDGNLWVGEQVGNKVAKITTVGVITEYAVPTGGSGPLGITAGGDGNLWFTEFGGNRVGRLTTAGVLTEFTVPTGGSNPWAITAGPDGNVWFTESAGNKIGVQTTGAAALTQVVSASTMASTMTLGSSNDPSVTGQTISYTATLRGVPATTATAVYGQVGNFTTVTANGGGVTANSSAGATGVAVDGSRNVYIADSANHRVLFYPFGSTTATRVYGQGGSFTTGTANKGGISANSLNYPTAVTLDASGNVYIADSSNNRVLFYPGASTTATRVYGQGGSFTSNTPNLGGTTATSFNYPTGVTVDSGGTVYVTDYSNSRVLAFPGVSTTATQVWGQGGILTTGGSNYNGVTATSLAFPYGGVAFDATGDMYIADQNNNRVLMYPPASTTATRVYGQGGSFVANTANNGGITGDSISSPAAVLVDGAGNVYISDGSNSRLLVYPPGTTTAHHVFGQSGSFTTNTGNQGGPSATSLGAPQSLALDSAGTLYVADWFDNRTMSYATAAPTGTVTFSDAGSPIAGCAAAAINGSGQATCTPAAYAAINSHVITTSYAGDSNYTGSVAPGLIQVVNNATSASVLAWGADTSGTSELGDGRATDRFYPDPVPLVSGITQVASDKNYVIALKSDGTVWTWGANTAGQLGDGTTTPRTTPIQVPGLSGIVQVATGQEFSMALASDGTIWTWGRDNSGQLGDGATSTRSSPFHLAVPTGVVMVAGHNRHAAALTSDGSVFTWGANVEGELGNGSNDALAHSTPTLVAGLPTAQAIAVGEDDMFAILTDNSVRGWGGNIAGDLGDGTTSERDAPIALTPSAVVQVAAGNDSVVMRLATGSLISAGSNSFGQLGNNSTTSSSTFVSVLTLSNAVTITDGNATAGAQTADNKVWSWGDNGNGQLGINNQTDSHVPVQVHGQGNNGLLNSNALGEAASLNDMYVLGVGLPTANVAPPTSSLNPSTSGQSVTFSATVAPAGPASTTATSVYGQGGVFNTGVVNKGGIGANSLNNSEGAIATDSAGGLYVTDWSNNRVLYYPAGSTTATRVYGQGGSFTTNTANYNGVTATSMTRPESVAIDAAGGVYVADGGNNRVLYFPAGTTAATRVYGQAGSLTSSTVNNGGISANSLNSPFGVAVDGGGNVWIADGSNNRVLFYPGASTTATRVYGQPTMATGTANNGGIIATSMSLAECVTPVPSGVYICDYNNSRVLFYPGVATTPTRVFGQHGSFTTGASDSPSISADTLNQPEGVAVNPSGDVYIGDLDNRVLYYPAGTTTATVVYGQGGSFTSATANNGGITANSLSNTEGPALDQAGNLYLSDGGNSRVLKYPPLAAIPTGTVTFMDGTTSLGSGTLNGGGVATYTTASLAAGSHPISAAYNGDGTYSPVTSAAISQVVTLTASGTLLSSNNNPSVAGQNVTFSATVGPGFTASSVYGQGGNFSTGGVNTGGLSALSLDQPIGQAADGAGGLYIADTVNNRVLYFPTGSTTATRVYGQGGSFTSNTVDLGGISATSLSSPKGVALDSGGNLYVADSFNNRVLFYPAGSTTATRVYGQGGNFTLGTANTGGISANSLDGPVGLRLDAGDNLYIADYTNNRVLSYASGSTTATRVYGQGGSFIAGTANNGGVSAVSLNSPTSVTVDATGNLYIADFLNNRVLYYAAASTTATRVYGQGGSFASNGPNGGGVSATSLWNPADMVLDPGGNLYIADQTNNRVLFFTSSSTTATRVYGQAGGFATNTVNNGGVSATSLDFPNGLALDPSGILYVADYNNNRVLAFPVPSATATGTVTFKDGVTTLGSGTLAGGTATYSLTTLTVGVHSITAVYGGDATFAASTSSSLSQTVNAATSSTAVVTSGSPSTYDSAVTFTATVTFSAAIPSGESVTFCDGGSGGTSCTAGVLLGTGLINSGTGVATDTISVLSVASHTILAYYPGDSTYPASSGSVTQVVNGGTLTIAAPGPLTIPGAAPGTSTGPAAIGSLSFSNTLGDQTPWSVTLGATDLCKAGTVGMPFSMMTIGVDQTPTGGGGAVGVLSPGTASQGLSGADSPTCTTFSATALLASGTANLGDTPGTAGTWTMANNRLTVVSLGTATPGSYTGTIQYTITG